MYWQIIIRKHIHCDKTEELDENLFPNISFDKIFFTLDKLVLADPIALSSNRESQMQSEICKDANLQFLYPQDAPIKLVQELFFLATLKNKIKT